VVVAGLLSSKLDLRLLKAPKPVAGCTIPPKADWIGASTGAAANVPNILLTAFELVEVALPSDIPPKPPVESDMEASRVISDA
jgi:hypothetical protein